MCVIGNRNNSTGCPICFFSAFYLYDSAQDHRLRLLPIFNYCVLSNVSKMYLQPQKNAVNPLAVLFVFLFRFILPSLHLSPIAGIRGAAVGISVPWRNPLCTHDTICKNPAAACSSVLQFNPRCREVKRRTSYTVPVETYLVCP